MTTAVGAALTAAIVTAGLLTAPSASGASPCRQQITLGTSVKGRSITACELGDPRLRPLLFVGEIHGDEPGGRSTAERLMARPVPSGVHLWVVRTMNPDGHAAGRRQNAHGVDLNRNFPTDWRYRTGTYASGPSPASEPETKAIIAFIRRIKPHTTVIAHQPFNVVDISKGGDPRVSRRLADLNGMRVVNLSDSNAPGATTYTGVLTSWANASVRASTAVTFEFARNPSTYRRHRLADSLLTLSKERAAHRYGVRLGLVAAPDPLRAGASLSITGAISIERRTGGYVRAAGLRVRLLQQRNDGSWGDVWAGVSRADGTVAVSRTLSSAACFKLRFSGDSDYAAGTSAAQCVRVTP